jgi:hypothetical protein
VADELLARPPPALVGIVAAHHDRGAVLARDPPRRARGSARFIRSPRAGRAVVIGGGRCTCRPRAAARHARIRGAIAALVLAAEAEVEQLLAMMPVRADAMPVRMVEWPGQVSVALLALIALRNTTPSDRRWRARRRSAGDIVGRDRRELVGPRSRRSAWAACGRGAAAARRQGKRAEAARKAGDLHLSPNI